jgi:uncharacterized phage-associated protein
LDCSFWKLINNFSNLTIPQGGLITTPKLFFNTEEEELFLKSFWKKYSKLDPWALVNSAHTDDTPWYQIKSAYLKRESFNTIIPTALMKSYFHPY